MYNDLSKELDPFPECGYVFGAVTDVKSCPDEFIDYYEIIIDIVNDKMMEFDKVNYNDNLKNKNSNERPALYFYYLTIRTLSNRMASFFDNRQGMGYFKYIIKQSKYSSNYFWDNDFYFFDNYHIIGDITFIASPPITNPYDIQLTDEKKNVFEPEIPKECIIKDRSLLDIRLSELFTSSSGTVDEVNIYHVGSGYYSYFQYNDGSRFFFDIGLTKFKDRNCIKCPDHGYDNFKFGILSHWDQDHYMGITLHDRDKQDIILSMPWICPSIICNANAKRLAFLIRYHSTNNLIMIDQSISGSLYRNSNMALIKGYCYKGEQSIMKNANGLGLFIKNKKKFVVLGDVGYKYLNEDDYLFNSTDYLVVPHHGADPNKVGQVNIKPAIKNSSMAIIPVGENPVRWGHPKKSTLDSLELIGYNIYQTNIKGDLKVKLNNDKIKIIKRIVKYLRNLIIKLKKYLK